MKKILLLSIVTSLALYANENYIEVTMGASNIKDNFNVDSKELISSHSKADNKSITVGHIDFYFDYPLNNNSKLYISSEETLNIGINTMTNVGMFDFGMLFTADEEWENPFLLNEKRKSTDSKEGGIYLAYGWAFNHWSESALIYSYSEKEYDKETVSSDLKREGDRNIISFENSLKMTTYNLDINTEYEKYNAKGKSSTYDMLSLKLSFQTKLSESISLKLMTFISKKEYDKKNAIFSKTVDSKISTTSAIIKYKEPFAWKNGYVSFKAEIGGENANVDFYDKHIETAMIGVGYIF